MLKREVLKVYKEYMQEFDEAYSVIKSYYDIDKNIEELCKLRGYLDDDYREFFKKEEIGCCSLYDVALLGENRHRLGLVSENEYFLLDSRYIIPIKDITGGIVALVGWYPDVKKYITTPSMFFAKEHLFYNIDEAYRLSWEKFDGKVFLVEGMFDAISLRVLGLPVIGTMGVTVGLPKSEQLKLFKKVIAIPDGDKAGKRALNRYDKKYGWQVPLNTTFVKIKEGELQTEYGTLHVKDIDNIVSYYEHDSVRDMLLEIADSNEESVDLIL